MPRADAATAAACRFGIAAHARQQATDFGDRESWAACAALGPFQHGGRIVTAFSFGVEKPIKLAHRGEPPRQRRGLEAALGQAREKSAQVVGVGGGNSFAGGAQMRREIIEIVAIGLKRIFAGAALGRQHVEEQLDQRFVGSLLPAGHRLALR